MSGFAGPPPPLQAVWADTSAEAWAIYRAAPEQYGYPVQVGNRWLVPRPVRVLNARLAAETAAVNEQYGPIFVETPGGSVKRAQLKPEDRRRIAQQVTRQRRARAEQTQRPAPRRRQAVLF